MAGIPRCTTHHIWHVNCSDCCDQRRAEQAAAKARLARAAR